MAEAAHLGGRRLRRALPAFPPLFGLRTFCDRTTRSIDRAGRGANAVRSRNRNELESTRAGDRLAILSSGSSFSPLSGFAVQRCPDHSLQSVGPPDFSGW